MENDIYERNTRARDYLSSLDRRRSLRRVQRGELAYPIIMGIASLAMFYAAYALGSF